MFSSLWPLKLSSLFDQGTHKCYWYEHQHCRSDHPDESLHKACSLIFFGLCRLYCSSIDQPLEVTTCSSVHSYSVGASKWNLSFKASINRSILTCLSEKSLSIFSLPWQWTKHLIRGNLQIVMVYAKRSHWRIHSK